MTNNNRNGYNNNSQRGRDNNDPRGDLEKIEQKLPIDDKFKSEYVNTAHDVICGLSKGKVITRTKIRSIYNMLCDIIANESHSEKSTLSSESITALMMFKVHVIYECGRDDAVKAFVINSHIIGYLLDIGTSRAKFEAYCKYFESLIAYHRFLYVDKD